MAESDNSRLQQLERLIAEGIERVLNEGQAAIDAICRANPEFADDVRASFQSLERMGLFDAAEPDPLGFPEEIGDFRLKERLGGGGMGLVFRAEQVSLGREVALKLVRPDQLWFDGTRERFQREVETIASLHHPGIVPIHTVGQERGVPYFAMACIDGATLAEVLDALNDKDPSTLTAKDLTATFGDVNGRDPADLFVGSWVDACLGIARAVAEALDYAHSRGVTHRDVKPSNIMVTRDGRVVVLDFGLASSGNAERLTRSGARLGSLAYMSPQQVEGDVDGVGAQSDVYSLGVTLYELLTLRSPFMAPTTEATIRRVLDGRPEPASRHNKRVQRTLDTVCSTAMRIETSRRYESAAMFARELDNVLHGRPIEAVPPGIADHVRSFVRRHRLASALAAALVVSLAAFAGFMVVTAARSEERAVTAERVSSFLENMITGIDAVGSGVTPAGNVLVSRRILDRQYQLVFDKFGQEPATQARLLCSFAIAYGQIGRISQSLVAGQRARDVAFTLGRHTVPYLRALAVVAGAQAKLAHHDRAITTAAEAADLCEKMYGADPVHTAWSRRLLASVLSKAGRTNDARATLERALHELGDRADAAHERDLCRLLLAGVLGSKDPARAEQLAREAITGFEKGGLAEPALHARLELVKNLLARRRPEEARQLADAALAHCRNDDTLGAGTEIAALLVRGRIETAARELQAAKRWFTAALELARSRYGAGHPNTVEPTVRLANTMLETDELAQAETLLRERIRRLQELDPDPSAPGVLWLAEHLGTVLGARGDHAGSLRLLEDVVHQLSQCGTPMRSLRARLALANAYLGLDELAAAEREIRALLRDKKLSQQLRARCLSRLGAILRRRGRDADAVSVLVECADLEKARFGATSREYAGILHRLVAAQMRLDPRAAVATAAQVVDLIRKKGRPERLVSAATQLGDARALSGDVDGGERDLRAAVRLAEQTFGATHQRTTQAWAKLALFAASYGRRHLFAQAARHAEQSAVAHEKHGDHWFTWWVLRIAHAERGDYESARRCGERGGSRMRFRLHLAFDCQALGDRAAARDHLDAAITLHRAGRSYPEGESGYRILEATLAQGDRDLLVSVAGDVARKADLHLRLPAHDARHVATLMELGTVAIALGAPRLAERLLRHSRALHARHVQDLRMGLLIDAELGWCLLQQWNTVEAERLLEDAATGLARLYRGYAHWRPRRTAQRLVTLFERTGRTREAETWRRRIP